LKQRIRMLRSSKHVPMCISVQDDATASRISQIGAHNFVSTALATQTLPSPADSMSGPAENNTATLDALPTECLAVVLGHLPDARDVAACQCASKRLRMAADMPIAWQRRLDDQFDIRLQVRSTIARTAMCWRQASHSGHGIG